MRTPGFSSQFHWLRIVVLVAVACVAVEQPVSADESISLYFEQLRRRHLFSLAESYAMSRLAQPSLPRPRRLQLIVELSKTLAEHADNATEQQQQELWARARSVVDEQRTREPTSPFDIVLKTQSAMVSATAADWLRAECDLHPFDESLAARTRQECVTAIEQLTAVELLLSSPPKEPLSKSSNVPRPSSYELRVLLHQVRFALAQTRRNRAELFPANSRERILELVEAEQWARKIAGNADEPVASRAKLLLATCARLKGEKGGLDRAEEMLGALQKAIPTPDFGLTDAIAAERIQILLDRHQAPNALQLTLQLRSNRKQLAGELWYLRTRALVSMRDIAVTRKDANLAKELSSEAETTLNRCAEQVGGFWSRRCRELWDATQTAEKYGPELDALMQQARADFLANRIDASLNGYARGEKLARTSGQTELAFALGYTRASILLREKQYEAGSTEFLRLSHEYSQNGKAAAAHLNGAYCLGRMYDEQKTQSRREAYTAALDQQMERFASDPTSDDARFFKAQLEEQRLQATVALPLYLKVDKSHSRAAEAQAGSARCYETILNRMRERKLPLDDFRQKAVETLSQFTKSQERDGVKWGAPQCEVAIHLATILLLSEPPNFERAEQLYSRIIKDTSSIAPDDEQADRMQRLRQRAQTLRVVAIAGFGRPGEAERMIDSLATGSPRDLLFVVERLGNLIDTPNRQRQIQYVNLLLRAADQLGKHGAALSKEEQDQLDQALGQAYLASGQLSKALEMYQRQATASVKDANRQRELAILVSKFEQREFTLLARQCWRHVESLTKRGSTEWMTARLGVISTTVQLNETAEAQKLLIVTKTLYPDLGGPELKARFVTVEKDLESNSEKGPVRK